MSLKCCKNILNFFIIFNRENLLEILMEIIWLYRWTRWIILLLRLLSQQSDNINFNKITFQLKFFMSLN